jgi:hypothetical protein
MEIKDPMMPSPPKPTPRSHQNGLTITSTTMAIMSTVGSSFMMR